MRCLPTVVCQASTQQPRRCERNEQRRAFVCKMSITQLLAQKVAASTDGTPFDQNGQHQRELDEHLRHAIEANEVDALSIILGSITRIPDQEHVKASATSLLRLAMRSSDAAECALYLLNYLEELRRVKEDANGGKEEGPVQKECLTSSLPDGKEKLALVHAMRHEIIDKRESFCSPAPSAPLLLTLAREALAPRKKRERDEGESATPAPRCGRALLLQAHRLRKQKPRANKPLYDVDGATPLVDSNGDPSLQWPTTPIDLPPEYFPNGGHGGVDLSLGGEAVPLQWVNEEDYSTPPPIVFVRRCIDVDVRPDWAKKPARCCSRRLGTGLSYGDGRTVDVCSNTNFQGAGQAAVGTTLECNWACGHQGTCDLQTCCRRSMQRGAGHRLQVYKHKYKGWCLRTLTPISSGAFIMEYVAERVSAERSDERGKDTPDIETYLMGMELKSSKKSMLLDALVVRNHAAFAAFACARKFANMKKQQWATSHWDPQVPQVGFVATRDIEPGEELTYLRSDNEPNKRNSWQTCGCKQPGCSERI